MFKSMINELLYGKNITVKSFNKTYPDEQVILSFSATFNEFNINARKGFLRRGIVIFTKNQISFRSVQLSLYSFVYIFGALFCFWSFLITHNYFSIIAGVFIGAMTIQRLPLQRNILFKTMKQAELYAIQGKLFFGAGKKFHRLKVLTNDKVFICMIDQVLSSEEEQKLKEVYDIISEQKAD